MSWFGWLNCWLLLNTGFRLAAAAMLRNATYIAIAAFLVFLIYIFPIWALIWHCFIAVLFGCIAGVIVGLITEYYTGSTGCKRLADISRSGAATNLIYGLSVGMESVVAPVILLGISSAFCIPLWRRFIWCFIGSSFYACNSWYYHDR